MSTQITTAFVQQYKANVIILSQQKGSVLRGTTRIETVNGKSHFFERLGATAAVKRTSRHGDTPLIETPHSRRMVVMDDYEWADLVDQQDKIRLLISPQSEYAINGAYAMNRAYDDVVIASLYASAWGGETGATEVVLPSGQKVAQDGSPSTITLAKILAAKSIMDKANVAKEDRFLLLSPAALNSLLNVTEVKSADYNSVKALVRGEIDTYLGFKFLVSTRLPLVTTGTYRAAYAWQKNAVGVAMGQDITTRITERADKSYSVQVYLSQTIGGTRIEDEGVVEIPCLATD